MNKLNLYNTNFYIKLIILLCLIDLQLLAQTDLKDVDFFDNATQYDSGEGIQTENDTSATSQDSIEIDSRTSYPIKQYDDPNLRPIASGKKENKKERKSFGMSFSDIASKTVHTKSNQTEKIDNSETKTQPVEKASFGFSFSDMASFTTSEKQATTDNQ